MAKLDWGKWQPIPHPDQFLATVTGPEGPGVFQVRNRVTTELILFGISATLLARLRGLLPKPYGTATGTSNQAKLAYVMANHGQLDYRTRPTLTREDAVVIEKLLKADGYHKFS